MTEWTRNEILQVIAIVVSTVTAIIGIILTKMITSIHVIINNRLSQMLAGARAEGGLAERDLTRKMTAIDRLVEPEKPLEPPHEAK